MKNILSNTKMLAALLMAGVAFTACSSDDNFANETQQSVTAMNKYTMTVNATKGEDAPTRGLYFDGTALNVKWYDTDKVTVFPEDWSSTLGTLTAAASATGSTTLTGEVTGASVNNKLNLLFPRAEWSYTGQTGILLDDANSIEKKYDYATAQVSVNSVVGKTITTDAANLTSQQAIVKFKFRNSDNSADVSLTGLNIHAMGCKLVTSRAYGAGGWEPSGYEVYSNTDYPYYFYLELPFEAGMIDIMFFSKDNSFGTSGCKQVGGKYIYRLRSDMNPGDEIDIRAMGSDMLDANRVSFTNGAYYTYVDNSTVSTTIPSMVPAGIQSTFGDLDVTPDAATSTLTVALRNELATADKYILYATGATKDYICFSPSTQFLDGKYYEITVKMKETTTYSSKPAVNAVIKVGDKLIVTGKDYVINGGAYTIAGDHLTAAKSPYTLTISDDGTKYVFKDKDGAFYCAKNLYTVTGTSDGLYVDDYYTGEAEYFELEVHEP